MKPVKQSELFRAIDEQFPAQAVPPDDASLVQAAGAIDRAAVLKQCGGQRALMQELAAVCLTESEQLMIQIKSAVAAEAGTSLAHAAHTLKGAVGALEAHAAYEAARRLEELGRASDWLQARPACAALEQEMDWLLAELRQIAAGDAATSAGSGSV